MRNGVVQKLLANASSLLDTCEMTGKSGTNLTVSNAAYDKGLALQVYWHLRTHVHRCHSSSGTVLDTLDSPRSAWRGAPHTKFQSTGVLVAGIRVRQPSSPQCSEQNYRGSIQTTAISFGVSTQFTGDSKTSRCQGWSLAGCFLVLSESTLIRVQFFFSLYSGIYSGYTGIVGMFVLIRCPS